MVFIYKVKTFSKRISFLLPLPLEGYSCGGKMDNENISVISFIQGLFSLIPVTGNVLFVQSFDWQSNNRSLFTRTTPTPYPFEHLT